MELIKKTHKVNVSHDLSLYVVSYRTDGIEDKPILHILHGMGEHSGRYHDFASFMAKQGYIVYLHDHRHHGESLMNNQLGVFSKTDTFDKLAEDVKTVQLFILELEKQTDVTMLGHSMGSVILRRFLQLNPPNVTRAIIMGSPPMPSWLTVKGFNLISKLSGIKKSDEQPEHFMAKLLNDNIIKGHKEIKDKHDWISTDEDVVKSYQKDPKSGFVYNKYFYCAFFKGLSTVNQTQHMKQTIDVPHLYISGDQDPLANQMKNIKTLIAKQQKHQPFHQADMIGIEGARHEVLNEKHRHDTYQIILRWMIQH